MAMEEGSPLLDQQQTDGFPLAKATAVEEGKPLLGRQTGGIRLPSWAYRTEVASLVDQLASREEHNASNVMVYYEGFTEEAYRFLFAYEDKYPSQSPHLITVLPSGNRQGEKDLSPGKGKGVISYCFSQSMDSDIAATQLRDAGAFVWPRGDGRFTVVQVWPCEYNDEFRAGFVITDENMDPGHFNLQAFDDFKKAMFNLFKLDSHPTDLPFKYAVKKHKNTDPLYVGKGEELMSMLRCHKHIREKLKIKHLVEPNGFQCTYLSSNGVESSRTFHMDLTLDYCLYTKKGGETMACVKAKDQFDTECEPQGEGVKMSDVPTPGEAWTYVMDLDWFTHEAYWWMWTSAAFAWTIACLTVSLRFLGALLQWEWANNVWVSVFATGVAGSYALCADFSAMKWCVVPWLQNVGKPRIMGCNTRFFLVFLMVQLLSTCLQAVTIQGNAWFMVTAFQSSEDVLDYWVYLWSNSVFGGLPKSTWETWLTPKSSAIALWVLSTGQLVLPLLTAVPTPGSANTELFPTRTPPATKRLRPTCSHRPSSAESLGYEPAQLEEGNFLPEEYYHDFVTLWARLRRLFTFRPSKKCTYRESVAKLALASGLRYTASMSISYPKQRIDAMINFKQGYKMRQGTSLEPKRQGWELRSIKEFKKLARIHVNRVQFIMLLKLALQMNLQMTFIIIDRIQQDRLQVFPDRVSDVAGHVSIMSLLLNFSTELLDVIWIACLFFSVRSAVKKTLFEVGINPGAVYAVDDFISDDSKTSKQISRISYSGSDLLHAYGSARKKVCQMLGLAVFSTWLIGYALLKWYFALTCDHGAWAFTMGCLLRIDEASG